MLKSCRSKMATLAQDVCDVHRASLLYIKTCWQSLYRVSPTGGMGESPQQQKICSFTQPNKKIKTSFLATFNKNGTTVVF